MTAPRLVLLHSPLLGPFSWRAVAAELAALGLRPEAPAWPKLSSVATAFYPTLAGALAATLDGGGERPIILAAHSGAGPLAPALVEALTAPLAGVVFVDALLPHRRAVGPTAAVGRLVAARSPGAADSGSRGPRHAGR